MKVEDREPTSSTCFIGELAALSEVAVANTLLEIE